MRRIFPELKFIDENGFFKQLEKIVSEVMEAEESFMRDPIDVFAMEVGDIATSAITLLYIIENRTGIKAEDILAKVREKNDRRGYGRKTGGRQVS